MTLTPVELEQRQKAALKHGATSPTEIDVRMVTVRRRFLTRKGLRVSDLDAVGRARLDGWVRAQAKCELLDRYFAEHGLLNEKGEPRPATAVYFTALNSARLALNKLDEHLRTRIRPPEADLEAHLETTYREDDGSDND